MINVNQITAQLARMPDQALQRYAQMHKQDPYVLSLALAESTRRKEMRAGAQMQAPEQPKVVDQAIAGMGGLPTLPADNLRGMEQTMAAGGIVAFDEGGEVPRYQSQGLVRKPLTTDTEFGIPGFQLTGVPIMPQPGAIENQTWMQRKLDELVEKVQRGAASPQEKAWVSMFGGDATKRVEGRQQQSFYAPAPDQSAAETARLANVPAPTNSPVDNQQAPAADGSAAPSTGGGLRAGLGYAGLQPYLGGGLGLNTSAAGTAQELQNVRSGFTDEVPFAQQQAIEKYALAKRQGKEEGLQLLQEDIAKLGPGMEQAYARAQAREAKLGEREKEAGPMALIQAGLAIMGGESPYAMANIGKGGGMGLKAYAESIDKLELARDKLDETFSRIDAFRENRADMNAKAVRAAKAEIKDTYTEAEKLGLEALMKNTELNRADARSVFDSMMRNRATMYEVGARTALGIAGLETQERIAGGRESLMRELYGGSNRAMAEYGKIQQRVMAELGKNPMYANEPNEAKKTAMFNTEMRKAMQANPFLSAYSAGIGFQSAPSSGKVYDLLSPS